MTGIRFYLEFDSPQHKRRGEHSGNVLAAYVCNGWYLSRGEPMIEGASAVYDWPNSAVCGGSASRGYLRTHCKRISEARAREIHPALFAYLEAYND